MYICTNCLLDPPLAKREIMLVVIGGGVQCMYLWLSGLWSPIFFASQLFWSAAAYFWHDLKPADDVCGCVCVCNDVRFIHEGSTMYCSRFSIRILRSAVLSCSLQYDETSAQGLLKWWLCQAKTSRSAGRSSPSKQSAENWECLAEFQRLVPWAFEHHQNIPKQW